MEGAIQRTLDDTRKLECQISAILEALQSEKLIDEADLIELPSLVSEDDDSDNDNGNGAKKRPAPGNVRDSKRKLQPLSISQRRKKSIEMDSAPLPYTYDEKNTTKPSIGYELIRSSMFLIPIIDSCVFGLTLVNVSSFPLDLPELILTTIGGIKGGSSTKSSASFTYTVQITPLDAKRTSHGNRHVAQGIPYYDTFIPRTNKTIVKIQPGCQILLTATFLHPSTRLMNAEDLKLKLLISILLNDKPLICTTMPIQFQDLCNITENEATLSTHRVSALTALSSHRRSFGMNRLLSQGDKSPQKAIQKFLASLFFDKIFTEETGIDTTVDIWACNQSQISMLWGVTFKVEKCSRSVNNIRCCASTRSETQMEYFLQLLEKWISKEGKQERSRGLRGLTVTPITTEDHSILSTLLHELRVVEDLMQYCNSNRKNPSKTNNNNINNRSSSFHHEWIREFYNAVQKTDEMFMTKLLL